MKIYLGTYNVFNFFLCFKILLNIFKNNFYI